MNEARIDKWMWAVRIFKTRTIAAEACKKGRISINGALAKAARTVKPGDVIQVRKPPVTYSFKVLQPIEKRVGAKLVAEMMENVTTPEQYELLEMSRVSGFVNRAKGTGRPTKKDRRSLEEFTEPEFLDDFDFEFDFEEELNLYEDKHLYLLHQFLYFCRLKKYLCGALFCWLTVRSCHKEINIDQDIYIEFQDILIIFLLILNSILHI